MEQLRAQFINYLEWLDSRSLTGTLTFNASAPAPEELTAPVIESPAPDTWQLGFYSSSEMTEEEFTLVTKIALALGLGVEDFRIWADDSLIRVPQDVLRSPFIVALGPGSGQTLLAIGQTVVMNSIQTGLQASPVLTIPHPRAMLKEPQLKAGAWTALQKLKSLMQH